MSNSSKYRRADPIFLFIVTGLAVTAFFNNDKWDFASLNWSFEEEQPYLKEIPAPEITFGEYAYGSVYVDYSSSEPNVYSTIDGSTPTLSSPKAPIDEAIDVNNLFQRPNELIYIRTSHKWKAPIGEMPRAIVQKAAAYVEGKGFSEVSTKTYYNKAAHNLPVVSISGEASAFFDDWTGIYVPGNAMMSKKVIDQNKGKYHIDWWDYPSNYHQRGKAWQRNVHFEFIDKEAGTLINMPIGIRLNGNATRSFPQKSLRLYANQAGSDSLLFNFPVEPGVLPNLLPESGVGFKHLILRNSGNDWDKTMFRDILAMEIMQGTDNDLQGYQQSVVYLNGEYWGIHNIRPRLNEDYFALQNQVGLSDLAMLEKNSEIYHGDALDVNDFRNILAYAETEDISASEHYQYVANKVDVSNFIDYLWAEIYLVNTDWPANNIKYWKLKKSAEQGETKWRWILMDTDYGMGYTYDQAYETNMFKLLDGSNTEVARLFKALTKNKEFCGQFTARGNQLLETQFDPDRINGLIDEKQEAIESEMPNHIARWRKIKSMEQWKSNVQVLRNFAKERPAYIRKQMAAYFEGKL